MADGMSLSLAEREAAEAWHRPYEVEPGIVRCSGCITEGNPEAWPCFIARCLETIRGLEAERDTAMQRVLGELGGLPVEG